MARTTTSSPGFNYKQLKKLLRDVDAKKLLTYIKEQKPDSKAVLDGNRIKLSCITPEHSDSTTSCFIYTGSDSSPFAPT